METLERPATWRRIITCAPTKAPPPTSQKEKRQRFKAEPRSDPTLVHRRSFACSRFSSFLSNDWETNQWNAIVTLWPNHLFMLQSQERTFHLEMKCLTADPAESVAPVSTCPKCWNVISDWLVLRLCRDRRPMSACLLGGFSQSRTILMNPIDWLISSAAKFADWPVHRKHVEGKAAVDQVSKVAKLSDTRGTRSSPALGNRRHRTGCTVRVVFFFCWKINGQVKGFVRGRR